MNKTHLAMSICLGMSLVCPSVTLAQLPPKKSIPLELEQHVIKENQVWNIQRNYNIQQLQIGIGGSINSPGSALTMIADGQEIPIKPGVYNNVKLRKSARYNQSPAGETARGVDDFRASLYIDHNGLNKKYSVFEAIKVGEFDSYHAKNLEINSQSDNFNGVIVNGPVSFKIENSKLNFLGNGDGSQNSDFSGFGAPVAAYNGAKVIVSNSSLISSGVARSAIFSYNDADVLVQDSELKAFGGELYEGYLNTADFSVMVAPPWVLGITGSARTTNMMGNKTTFTVVRSTLEAANWGVLSTDLGDAMVVNVVDSSLTLTGTTDPFSQRFGSGYGSYILGSEQFYYGVSVSAGTYAGIVRNGKATYASSKFKEPLAIYSKEQFATSETKKDFFGVDQPVYRIETSSTPVFEAIEGLGKVSHIESDNFGWMFHGHGDLYITDGTEVNTGNSTFLLKDGNANINLDGNAKINPANHVLLQVMDNDDMLVGLDFDSDLDIHFNKVMHEAPGYAGIDYELDSYSKKRRNHYQLSLAEVDIIGDIYNASGFFGGQAGDDLKVNLSKGAKLTGTISASSAIHVDEHGQQVTRIDIDHYYYLGHVVNKPFDSGVNDVSVDLAKDSLWLVSGESRLRSLKIVDTNSLRAANCDNLSMTIDGKLTPIIAGHYTGHIVISPCKNN